MNEMNFLLINIKKYFLCLFFLTLTISFCFTKSNADVPEPRDVIIWHVPYSNNKHVSVNIVALREYAYYHMGRHYHFIPSISLKFPGPVDYSYKLIDKENEIVLSENKGSFDKFGEHIIIFQLPILKYKKEIHYLLKGSVQYYIYNKDLKKNNKSKASIIDSGIINYTFQAGKTINIGDKNYTYTLIDKNGDKENFSSEIIYRSNNNETFFIGNELEYEKDQEIKINFKEERARKREKTRHPKSENITVILDGIEEKYYPIIKENDHTILENITISE